MLDLFNDPTPPPVDRAAIALRAQRIRRGRASRSALVLAVLLAVGGVAGFRLLGGPHEAVVRTGAPAQEAGQPCLTSSLSMAATGSSQHQSWYQPTATPPTEQHGIETQVFAAFTNTSAVSCSLEGTPAVRLLHADGSPLALQVTAATCSPSPCTGFGAVTLPSGNKGILLQPGDRAGSHVDWAAPYCGEPLGADPRLEVTVPGGDPVSAAIVDNGHDVPLTQPTCSKAIPGHGGLRVMAFQSFPANHDVTKLQVGLVYSGGPPAAAGAPPALRGGTVTLTGPGGTYRVSLHEGERTSQVVAPGHYTARGDSGDAQCSDTDVTVSQGQDVPITVTCSVK